MLRPISLEQRLRASTALQAVAAAVLLAAPLAPLPAAAQLSPTAHPTGGSVVAGQASIGQSANTTTINQSSQRAAVNWNTFDVGSQSTVQFQQPNSSAVTLNRVVGSNPSEIAGKISANGQVVIVNQAGLTFDKGSQINTTGLVVSAAGISNSNFMAGKMVFDQAANAGAKIENRGTITVSDEGLAALVAPRVRNSGKIQAKMGTVILAGAEADTLDLYGDGLVSINVTKQVASAPDGTKALVTNSGLIQAQGGKVVLTADAVDGVVQTLVDAGGRINANSTSSRTGRVLITGAGGDVRVEGVVTAEGDQSGTSGGEIRISGSNATIIGSHARISVAGQAGGGTVALGTTLKRAKDGGTGTGAATTATLIVQQGATISASARTNGNGGRVVALASGSTTMAGTITAKGGTQGGNGGYVEVSGGTVSLPGHVDTTAPQGTTGTMLLDPDDIWVSDTQPSGTTQNVSWFSPALLESENTNIALAAGGNLNVATSFNTSNTLNLGSYSLLLFGGTGLTIDHGFSISASGINLYTSSGAITLDGSSGVAGGIITAAQLAAITTPTTITMPAGNTLVMSGDGGIALGSAIIGSQGVPINEVDFYTNSGGISQNATGAIYATTVRAGTVVGDVSLLGTGNQVGNVPLFEVTSGDFSLVDSSALNATLLGGNNVFVQVSGGNALTLTTGAQISTGSSTSGRVSLVADALDVPRSATVTAGTVEIAPSTVGVAMSVLPTTAPAGTLTIDSELLAGLNTTTLRLGGYTDVPGGSSAIVPTSGSINIASAFNLSGIATTLDLESVGPVTQNAALTVNTLTGNAGAVTLTDSGNDITNLGSFTATSFTLVDPDVSGALNVIGPVTAPTVSLTAPSIDIASSIDATSSTTLVANGSGGTITEGGVGVIDTGLLTGSAGGGVTLDGANDIAQLGAFSPGGNFLLDNGSNALAIVGAFSGAGDTMTLNAGDITQSAAGVITAGTLTGSATNVDLANATGGNQIGTLGAFPVSAGDFLLSDGIALTVDGAVTANEIYLQVLNGQGLTLASTAALDTSLSSGLVTLVTDLLSAQTGASITGATVEIAPNTTGLAVSLAPSSPPADTLSIDQAALAAIDTTTLRIGAFTDIPAGATTYGSPTAGSINIASSVNLNGIASTLDVETIGAVTQNGPLVVNELTGLAGPVVLTTAGNDISYLGAFTAGGSFTLDNGANPLEIIGAFSGAGQTLTLNTGALSQSAAGIVTAGELAGSAAGVNLATASNDIATLGAFAPGGDFTLNNGANALQIVGAFSGAGDTLTLTTGALSQSAAGVVTAQELTGSAAGVDLGVASNDIATLGAFAPGGNFSLNNGANALQIVGAFAGAGDTLTLNTGALTQSAAGVVTAQELTGSAAGVNLGTASNDIATLGAFTPGGAFTLNNGANGLQIVGAFSGAGDTLTLTTGALSQSAVGVVTAQELTGSAAGVDLGVASNDIATLGAFAPGGNFNLNNGANALQIVGAFAGAGDTLTLNTGALTQSAAGVVTAQELTGSAAGVNLGTASNDIATLGAFTPGGDFTLNNGANGLEIVGAFSGAGDGLTLTTGPLTQSAAGVVTAGTLIGTASAVDLTTATNAIANIGPFTSTDGFSLTDSTGALTVVGAINGGPTVTLVNTGGSLGVDAPISATSSVTLDAIGITQTAAGVITTGTLTGSAGSGAAALSSATSLITDLGPFSAGGAFSLLDGANLSVVGNVSAGAGASIAVTGAGNAISVGSGVTVNSGTASQLALSTTGGDIDNAGSLVGGTLVSLNSGGGMNQSGMVTANAVTELAAGAINHSGNSIAGAGNITLTAGGAINQSAAGGLGTIEATGGSVTLTANAITQQAGAQILDPTAGQTISLTAANGIAFAGTIAAAAASSLDNPVGNVSLTATNGDINETENGSHTGVLSALNLTGSAVAGSALLDAPSSTGTANQVANLGFFKTGGAFTLIDGHALALNGNVTAGTDVTLQVNGGGNGLTVPSGVSVTAGTSAFLGTAMANLSDSGTITAPNIVLAAPLGTATVSGTLAGVVPDPTLDPLHKLANGAFPSDPTVGAWIIGGNIVLASGFGITGAGGGVSQLVIDLTSNNGQASLGNFNSTSTNLYLNLGLGTATGQIAVRALQVQYTQPGTSQLIDLTGTVDGYSGYIAAAASFIYPKVNNNYQLNGCPIGATSCLFALGQGEVPVFFGIPSFLFPFINPLKDLDVDTPEEGDDILIILPDVGERDY